MTEKNNRILKVWGIRDRIYSSDTCEIDLLTLEPNSHCSVHSHKNKINKFIVILGKLKIKTELGNVTLSKGENLVIEPPLVHQFETNETEGATIIEIAYTEKGKIDSNDINRIIQGGRIINNIRFTLNEMKKKNLLKIL